MAASSIEMKVGDYEIDLHPNTSLGKGTFGSVFVGRLSGSEKDIAAKLLECDADFVTEMDREAHLMKSIPSHTNVLQIIDYIKKEIVEKNNVQGWIILELCTLGNVREYAEKKALSVVQKVDLILQGAHGLQHLHSLTPSIIHHDVKLENLLVTGSEEDPVVKVGDFGISKFFAHIREQSVTTRVREGTEWYLAPELYRLGQDNKPEYNKAVDVFALGISALTLVEEQHGKRIWTFTVVVGKDRKGLGRHAYDEKITDVAALIGKSGASSDEVKRFKIIIAAMLVPDAQTRLTIHDVVDRLTHLRSALGVQRRVLEYQLDTVWTPTKLQVRRECLRSAEARADVREMMEQLPRVLQEEERENTLLTVDRLDNYTLWIHDGSAWTRCDAPDECHRNRVCSGYVRDGLVLTGGRMLSSSDNLPECYYFSLSKRAWRRLQDMITPRSAASAAEMTDMKLMVAGGRDMALNPSRACEVLDVRRGDWSSASPLPDDMTREIILGAAEGRAYTLGATHSSEVRFLEYDPESDTHNLRPSPPVTFHPFPNYIHFKATLAGVAGRIFLVYNDVDETNQALQYDPSTKQWHQLVPPTTFLPPWVTYRTITKEGKILLCGTIRTPENDVGDLIEEYNVHTRKWRVLDIRLPFVVNYVRDRVLDYYYCN